MNPPASSGLASRWLVHPMVTTVRTPNSRRVRLFRSSFLGRLEKKLAHLAGGPAGDDSLAAPRQCLVQVSRFQYPKTAYVLLGLQVRPVGDEHLTIGLCPQRLRVASRGEATGENPGTGSLHLFVEYVDIAHHRFA